LQPCIKIAFFKSSSDFRNWFETHHATAEELWVGYYKKNSGKPSISWFESVDEQPYDIPEVIKRAITNSWLAKNYDLSFSINPLYLRGDFDGNGKIDVAVLVKQRSTGKLGIAIVHGATDKVKILGAGVSIGNAGDNFEWMDTWQIYSKDRGVKGAGETVFPIFTATRFS
jgi:hypothetical protein